MEDIRSSHPMACGTIFDVGELGGIDQWEETISEDEDEVIEAYVHGGTARIHSWRHHQY